MDYYSWFMRDDAEHTTLLQSINTTINQQARLIKTQQLILDSSSKDASSNNTTPSFTFPTPITCGIDEYMTLTVLRWNGYHDWNDIPQNSQITFQKTGQAAVTLTLATYGKPPINNVATAIKNAWILAGLGAGFDMVYNQNRGCYILSFPVATTMTVLTQDLAKYMNVPFNTPITSVSNQIATAPVRAQKTINLALTVGGVTAYTSGLIRDASGSLINKNVLCHIPILSNSFILANYRAYVESEQSLRITNTSISTLSFEYIDTYTGLQVPIAETCMALEIKTYKL